MLQGNTTVLARIFVRHYDGRASPIADTDAAPTGGLDAVANLARGTHEFVANASGDGHVRFRPPSEATRRPTRPIHSHRDSNIAPTRNFVRAAELQAFSASSRVD